MSQNIKEFNYVEADKTWVDQISRDWGENAARHLHFTDGFTFAALHDEQTIGLVSSYWHHLYDPLKDTREVYIDFLEVRPDFRRMGVASHLINLTLDRAREHKVYQARSWSSNDKVEAIPMWKRLGFGISPATTFPRGMEVRGVFVTMVLQE